MKKNLILLTSTLIFVIFIFEIFIRIFFPQDLQRYWATHETSYGLIINKPNYHHKLHRFKNYKTSYSFGKFYNRLNDNYEKLSEKPKILVLGESFTFGWLLDNEETFVGKLQKDNPNFNFINSSVGAWGSSHYTLFADLYCDDIKPKKIILFLNSDDAYRGFRSQFYKMKNSIFTKNKLSFSDLNSESNFDKKIPFYKFFKSNSHLFMYTRNIVYNLIHKPYYNPWSTERYWPRPNGEFDTNFSEDVSIYNQKVYLKLKEISTLCKAELHIINLMWVKPDKLYETNPNKVFLKSAKSFFNANAINYYENSENMESLYSAPEKYLIPIDFHPNKSGADLIYLAVKDYVSQILSY